MDLQSLEHKLENELQQNPEIELKQKKHYSIPIHTLEVSYHPVMRNAMDILMKMMLLSFQKAKLRNVELLADILLVEPLFIHDLTNKMTRLGMIEKGDYYSLTPKGQAQLQSGIFEEELECTSRLVPYSPLHQTILNGDLEAFMELEDFPEPFPYIESEEIGAIEESMLVDYLQQELSQENLSEDETPTFITSIASTESIQINDIPLLCFVLYHTKEERYYARAYNTLTGAWDEQIEALLLENEKVQWQEF